IAAADAQYVTWPILPGDTAHPFVILSRAKTADYFTFIDLFASSAPNPAAGGWALYQSSRAGADLKALKGSLVVVYNGYDPAQFTFQRVFDTLDCSKKTAQGDSLCFHPIARNLNPAFADNASLLDGKTYALWLEAIPSSALAGFRPTAAPGFGSWWAEDSDF